MSYSISISIADQTLNLFQDGKPVKQYQVSTALNGTGSEKGSGKTPLGKHFIRAKIGGDQLENSVFVGRRPTGEIYSSELAEQNPQRDWILSRILWLSGCEIGNNRLGQVDTMQRYIYLHGTPDTEPMGIPKSHGCVRMRNQDIIELFDKVDIGTQVDITA